MNRPNICWKLPLPSTVWGDFGNPGAFCRVGFFDGSLAGGPQWLGAMRYDLNLKSEGFLFFFFFLSFSSLSGALLIVFWTTGCHLSAQFAADKFCDRGGAQKNSVEARDEWEVSPWNSGMASTDWIQCLFSLSLSFFSVFIGATYWQNMNLLVALGSKSLKSYSCRWNKGKRINFGFHLLYTLSIYTKEIREFCPKTQ